MPDAATARWGNNRVAVRFDVVEGRARRSKVCAVSFWVFSGVQARDVVRSDLGQRSGSWAAASLALFTAGLPRATEAGLCGGEHVDIQSALRVPLHSARIVRSRCIRPGQSA